MEKNKTANPGYVIGQLAKAFSTSQTHEDIQVRKRAKKKIENWSKVFEGMLSQTLKIGSSTPIANIPKWVTLEVIGGGFATGEFLAAGEIQSHEKKLLEQLGEKDPQNPRATLNSYYLSEKGFAELKTMLVNGCYQVSLAEEGALLTVAWLIENGHQKESQKLLDEIAPFFAKFRFYPKPTTSPLVAQSFIRLQNIEQTIDNLKEIKLNLQIAQMRETVMVWYPLYDQIVKLFLETMDGPAPKFKMDQEGKFQKNKKGGFIIEGGWPCQIYAKEWSSEAKEVIATYKKLRKEHKLCTKPDQSNFATLLKFASKCAKNPKKLKGKEVGMVRTILAGIVSKRDLPESPKWQALRKKQMEIAKKPATVEFVQVLIARLEKLPKKEGLGSLEEIIYPITKEEAQNFSLNEKLEIPQCLHSKLLRSLNASAEVLIQKKVISSAEVLAVTIPQITSQIQATSVDHPQLRQLYAAIYRAFSKRRSLLLLNLESQTKFADLPWIKTIESFRNNKVSAEKLALETLQELFIIAITNFPHMILPNKLLQEFRSLAHSAKLQIPIVEELAADIFMGAFSEKFLQAAQESGKLLKGTLYEKYYGVSYSKIQKLKSKKTLFGKKTADSFYKICCTMADSKGNSYSVAENGKIIEQAQILTTHNLAVLFSAFDLSQKLGSKLDELSRHCFCWICRRAKQKTDNYGAKLRMVKNLAYAWRQMIFYLSLMPNSEREMFVSWSKKHFKQQDTEFKKRFKAVLSGLELIATGSDFKEPSQRFLGWTTKKHSIM